MAEKMLVTQALDERDLLVKKIGDKIDKGFVLNRLTRSDPHGCVAGVLYSENGIGRRNCLQEET